MAIRIERVDLSDPLEQAVMKELDKICFPTDFPADTSYGVWWLAWDGDKAAGYAAINPPLEGVRPYLSRAGVLPEYRGQGIQKRLIRARLAYARKQGWREVVTDTSKDNVMSSNNLIGCGFRLFRPEVPWSFESGLYWVRKLF